MCIRDSRNLRVMPVDNYLVFYLSLIHIFTPQLFKEELMAGDGNITVWINSPCLLYTSLGGKALRAD